MGHVPPGDEVVVRLFEAPSIETLDEAGRLAALDFERILEAVEGSMNGMKEEQR